MKTFTLLAHDYGTDFKATFSQTTDGSLTFSKNKLLNVLSKPRSDKLNAAARLESVQAAYDYLSEDFEIVKVEE